MQGHGIWIVHVTRRSTPSVFSTSTGMSNASVTSRVSFPGKVTTGAHDVFVSDTAHHRILAESGLRIGRGKGFKDGSFADAAFHSPQGLCLVDGRDLYVCDTGNHAIRKCDLVTRTVVTVVGNGCQGRDRVGGNAGPAQEIASPWDICLGVSLSGKPDVLYIAAAGTHQIWAYVLSDTAQFWKGVKGTLSDGDCLAIAGSGNEENRNTSYPLKAGFAQPSGLSFDFDHRILYVAGGCVFFPPSKLNNNLKKKPKDVELNPSSMSQIAKAQASVRCCFRKTGR